MKPRNFPARRRRRELLAMCRRREQTDRNFITPYTSIGSGSHAEVVAANAVLVAVLDRLAP